MIDDEHLHGCARGLEPQPSCYSTDVKIEVPTPVLMLAHGVRLVRSWTGGGHSVDRPPRRHSQREERPEEHGGSYRAFSRWFGVSAWKPPVVTS